MLMKESWTETSFSEVKKSYQEKIIVVFVREQGKF